MGNTVLTLAAPTQVLRSHNATSSVRVRFNGPYKAYQPIRHAFTGVTIDSLFQREILANDSVRVWKVDSGNVLNISNFELHMKSFDDENEKITLAYPDRVPDHGTISVTTTKNSERIMEDIIYKKNSDKQLLIQQRNAHGSRTADLSIVTKEITFNSPTTISVTESNKSFIDNKLQDSIFTIASGTYKNMTFGISIEENPEFYPLNTNATEAKVFVYPLERKVDPDFAPISFRAQALFDGTNINILRRGMYKESDPNVKLRSVKGNIDVACSVTMRDVTGGYREVDSIIGLGTHNSNVAATVQSYDPSTLKMVVNNATGLQQYMMHTSTNTQIESIDDVGTTLTLSSDILVHGEHPKPGDTIEFTEYIVECDGYWSWVNETVTVTCIHAPMMTLPATGLYAPLMPMKTTSTHISIAEEMNTDPEVPIIYTSNTESWPEFGTFRIDDELFTYESLGGNGFEGVKRAQYNTEAKTHSKYARIEFVGSTVRFPTLINVNDEIVPINLSPLGMCVSHGVEVDPLTCVDMESSTTTDGKTTLTVSSAVGFPKTDGKLEINKKTYVYESKTDTTFKLSGSHDIPDGTMVADATGRALHIRNGQPHNLSVGSKVTLYNIQDWRRSVFTSIQQQ